MQQPLNGSLTRLQIGKTYFAIGMDGGKETVAACVCKEILSSPVRRNDCLVESQGEVFKDKAAEMFDTAEEVQALIN